MNQIELMQIESKWHESWTKYKIVPTLAVASTTPDRTVLGQQKIQKKMDEAGGTWNFYICK